MLGPGVLRQVFLFSLGPGSRAPLQAAPAAPSQPQAPHTHRPVSCARVPLCVHRTCCLMCAREPRMLQGGPVPSAFHPEWSQLTGIQSGWIDLSSNRWALVVGPFSTKGGTPAGGGAHNLHGVPCDCTRWQSDHLSPTPISSTLPLHCTCRYLGGNVPDSWSALAGVENINVANTGACGTPNAGEA